MAETKTLDGEQVPNLRSGFDKFWFLSLTSIGKSLMTYTYRYFAVLMLFDVLITPYRAESALTQTYEFNGYGNWSIDGSGFAGSDHTIFASIPAGSFVEVGYLYASTSFDFGPPPIALSGITYSGALWTDLGSTGVAGLHAYRADVTDQIRDKIGGGGTSPIGFQVERAVADPKRHIDGTALVVIYSNASELQRNIVLYDGFVPTTGTTIVHRLPASLHTRIPTFEALISLGIGFSTGGPAQHSLVDIDGRRLTSSAGGDDDGETNHDLITIGGYGDSELNPPDPQFVGRTFDYYDDELYNLALGNAGKDIPFISRSSSDLNVSIFNPGDHDDLIFFAGFNVVTEVPEPQSVLFGVFAVAPGLLRRRWLRRNGQPAHSRWTLFDHVPGATVASAAGPRAGGGSYFAASLQFASALSVSLKAGKLR